MCICPRKPLQIEIYVGSSFIYRVVIIVHFKRLGSRHFVKEMKIQSILLIYNMIFRKTNLKPFLKYIQKMSKSSRLSNLMRLKVR